LPIAEKGYGPEHPMLAILLANIAMQQYAQHKLADAESYYKRSLAVWKKSAESNSPNYGRTVQNLGTVYLEERKYDEAGALFEQALTIKESSLGPQSPEVANALNGLAVSDVFRGYYAEAEPFCKRALAILEKTSPPDYPQLIVTLTVYARVLQNTNRTAQAEILETRVMVYKAKLKNKPKTDLVSNPQ